MSKATTNGEAITINIPPIKVGIINVRIEGISPLICHSFSEKARKEILATLTNKKTKQREAKNPEEEFHAARYRVDNKGMFKYGLNGEKFADALPARYLKLAMIEAARFVDGLTITSTKQLVFVELGKDGIPLQVKNGKGYKTYGIDMQPEMEESIQRQGGKGPGTGAPTPRFRPIYREWSAAFDVSYNNSLMSAEQIVALLNYAGFHSGVCEHRPSRGGQNGMFRVVGVNNEK